MNRLLIALSIAFLLAGCGEKTLTKPPSDGAVVGMVQRDYHDPARSSWDRRSARPLATTIWYPAAADAKMTEIAFPADNPVFVGGWAARDAAPAEGGTRPLVLLSHGTGGSALQMMWLGRALAAKGYIAAAVDHHGNTAAENEFDARGFRMPWERARDISAVIDALIADPQFGPMIDERQIFAAGFSLGGYAMAALAGAETSLSRFQSFCAGAARDATCDPQPEFPDAEERFEAMLADDPALRLALGEQGRSFYEPRIRAYALIAPALAQALTDVSLLRISAPMLVIAGGADATAPTPTNAQRFADKVRTSRLSIIEGAGHYAFLDACAPKARRWVAPCRDGAGVDRAAVHAEAVEQIIRHFSQASGSNQS